LNRFGKDGQLNPFEAQNIEFCGFTDSLNSWTVQKRKTK